MKTTILGALVLLTSVPVNADDDDSFGPRVPKAGETWKVAKGVRFAVTDLDHVDEYAKYVKAKDADGLREMIRDRKLLKVDPGDGVKVLTVKKSQGVGFVEGRVTSGQSRTRVAWFLLQSVTP
jgi:hypothetical protein